MQTILAASRSPGLGRASPDGLSLVLDLRDPAAAVVARLATARVIHDVYFKYWDGRPVPPPARLLFADPRN
jgi:hypothetical protein